MKRTLDFTLYSFVTFICHCIVIFIVILRPPELFGQTPATFLPIHGGPHHLPTMGSGKRKKSWTRAVFSHLQRKGLEKRFQMQKYITKPDRRQLAASLGLTDAQVNIY